MNTASQTRTRLLSAAAEVIQSQGSQGATLDAVAKKAGVSKGGLLYHFPSRKALLTALIQDGLDEFNARVRRYEDQGAIWLDAYVQASMEPSAIVEWTSGVAGAVIADPELLAPVQRAYEFWYEKARSLGPSAQIALLALDGLWLHQVLGLRTIANTADLSSAFAALTGSSNA